MDSSTSKTEFCLYDDMVTVSGKVNRGTLSYVHNVLLGKFRAHILGFKIEEVPIVFKDRELGKSKMSSAIVGEAVIGVLKLKWQSVFNKNNF